MKRPTILLISFLITFVWVFTALAYANERAFYCEKCVRMEKSIRGILYTVEQHDPNFVMDVLSESSEWMILEELIGPINPPIIPDSVHKKMKQVFPDLPAEKAKPDKPIKPCD